jgi:hypothetical protein
MRKQVVVALLFLCVAACAENNRRDGNWWNQESAGEKHSYATGFFDGMSLGHEFSYWGMVDNTKDDNHQSPCLEKAHDSYSDFGKKFFSNITNSQLADGLDVFYKDYRNRSIRVSDAVWVVVNSIAGTTQEKIDQLTENLRKNAASEQ